MVTVGSPVVLVVEGLGVGGAGARGVEWIMGGRCMSDAVYIVITSYSFHLSTVACYYHHDMRETKDL
jgi:hypothetical protein